MRFPRASPIRVVLLDAFDTLVRPSSAPYLQYAHAAREAGLQVADESVKSAFKQAFTETSIEYPNYGLESREIESPDAWWHLVIRRTFSPQRHEGITAHDYEAKGAVLAQNLVDKFGTKDAYTLFDDVVPALRGLLAPANTQHSVRIGLATNSDTRILSVLRSFGLAEYLDLTIPQPGTIGGATLSYLEKAAKPDARFFHRAIARNSGEVARDQVLYVGDQLHEDFWGATDAGCQALWLQRPASASNQVYAKADQPHTSPEELAYVSARTITSLTDVVKFVTDSHMRADECD